VKAVSGGAFARALENRGWTLLRVNGSHRIYGKAGVKARLSIPIHGSSPLKSGLLAHLLRLASLTETDL
jgi:predicted RNA binding protein YcfA (HicA-like mRNA interferase family)